MFAKSPHVSEHQSAVVLRGTSFHSNCRCTPTEQISSCVDSSQRLPYLLKWTLVLARLLSAAPHPSDVIITSISHISSTTLYIHGLDVWGTNVASSRNIFQHCEKITSQGNVCPLFLRYNSTTSINSGNGSCVPRSRYDTDSGIG